MKIDLGDITKKLGNEIKIKEEAAFSFPEDDLVITDPVKLNIRLLNTGESILITGKIKARIKLNCVRCLKEFAQDVEVEIEEQFRRHLKTSKIKNGEVELKDNDFVFQIDADNTIDLGEAIRQNLLTALPIKPLCNKNCKVVSYKESKKMPDPRMAKLKDFLK